MEHLFNIELAKEYGVNAAIVIRHLQFWIIKNRSNGKHLHDGRTWTYCSIQAFTKIFPYWTAKQLRMILDHLVDSGIILKGKYNLKGYDQTTWYAFQDENAFARSGKSICPNGQMEVTKRANPFARSGKPIPNPITISDTDKATNGLLNSQQTGRLLELDRQIVQGAKLLNDNLETIFRLNSRERTTFTRLIMHLIEQCQAERLPVTIFKDAVRYAREARKSTARNKKGLFITKMKQETGFSAQVKLLRTG